MNEIGVVNELSELCNLAIKYKTDKINIYRHNYTKYYYELFKNIRYNNNNILEIGLGFIGFERKSGLMCMGHMKDHNYKPGASHYMWEEFFPNSMIYGIDINRKILFNTDRIKTFHGNQYNRDHLINFSNLTNNINFDIIIDDGSHIPEHQVFTMLYFLDFLNNNGLYIIEDVHPNFYNNINKYLTNDILDILKNKNCNLEYKDLRIDNGVEDDYLIIIKRYL